MENIHVPVVGTVSGLALAQAINAGFDSLQQNIGGALSKSVAGGSDVALSAAEANYGVITLTGALTADINIIVPAASMQWIFSNQTTGAFKLTVKTAAGTGVAVKRGAQAHLWCDASSILQVLSDAPSLFDKYDSAAPIYTKTGASTLDVKSYSIVRARNATVTVGASSQAVVMPALTAGTDYAIYVCDDLTFRADASFTAPTGYTASNSRLIGGFHYGLVAPGTTVAGGSFNTLGSVQTGGMVWTQGDVDNIAGINKFSLWDLKWRCNTSDLRAQRGFSLSGAGIWAGIYFASTDCDTNGLSKYNTDVASGTVLPKIPAAMGGNGVLTYADYNWWRASEHARAYGARLLTDAEFNIAAFGVTENQSLGGAASTIPLTTRQAGYTTKFGGEQYTGHHYIWGDDSNGGAASAYVANGGRGQSYANATCKVLLGGGRGDAAISGSRTSLWNHAPAYSGWNIGLRAACDHLMLA